MSIYITATKRLAFLFFFPLKDSRRESIMSQIFSNISRNDAARYILIYSQKSPRENPEISPVYASFPRSNTHTHVENLNDAHYGLRKDFSRHGWLVVCQFLTRARAHREWERTITTTAAAHRAVNFRFFLSLNEPVIHTYIYTKL